MCKLSVKVHRILADEEHENAVAFAAFQSLDRLLEVLRAQRDEDFVANLGVAHSGEASAYGSRAARPDIVIADDAPSPHAQLVRHPSHGWQDLALRCLPGQKNAGAAFPT